MHLKNNRSAGNGAYAYETTSRAMMTSNPKSAFDQMATIAPEIMEIIFEPRPLVLTENITNVYSII
jgi:hypothetical protein